MPNDNGSPSSAHGHYYCKNSNSSSIRQSVFEKLNENPSLTAKRLCKLLDLPYSKYWNYVGRLRWEWKYYHRNEHGSKCSIHAWRGWCYVPTSIRRDLAVREGWINSRARNRWLLWKDRLGRLQWFETGRVILYVRKPANLGKAFQLVCNAFSFTGLLTDARVLEQASAGIHFKGAHYVFNTEQPLPRLVIDMFAKSNGIIVKVGDTSHPNGVEIVLCYPDWAEKTEQVLKEIRDSLRHNLYERDSPGKPYYVR